MKLREEKKPMITIPLDLPAVRVLETEVTASGDFVITVESTVGHTTCRKCGRETAEFHSYDRWISLRHLPILDRAVWIRLRPKRYRCPWCSDHPTTTQRLSWYQPGADKTKAYEQYLLVRLVNSTIEDVSRKEQARKQLTQWQQRVSDRGLTCFDSFLTMLENWMDEITNYFLNRDSSGFVEGINTKIKVLKRRCYGIFNLGHLFQRLFLDLEGYRLFAKPAL
jgi:transposase